jgi:hypothetical protein
MTKLLYNVSLSLNKIDDTCCFMHHKCIMYCVNYTIFFVFIDVKTVQYVYDS